MLQLLAGDVLGGQDLPVLAVRLGAQVHDGHTALVGAGIGGNHAGNHAVAQLGVLVVAVLHASEVDAEANGFTHSQRAVATKIFRSVVDAPGDVPLFVLFHLVDGHLATNRVDVHIDRTGEVAFRPVRLPQPPLNPFQQVVEIHRLLLFDCTQRGHINIHLLLLVFRRTILLIFCTGQPVGVNSQSDKIDLGGGCL